MVLSIDDFRYPKFVIQKERKPFGEETSDKFYATDNEAVEVGNERRYRDGTFPQQGYSVSDNSKEPIKQNINNDSFTLRPY